MRACAGSNVIANRFKKTTRDVMVLNNLTAVGGCEICYKLCRCFLDLFVFVF